jgi:penicillin amidase
VTGSGRLTVLAGFILAMLVGASVWRVGPLPPLGGFLDPVRGVWTVARQAELPARAAAAIPRLSQPVSVRYDQRAVPHIFAANELDAVRALGYVVARDRLLQLELQWRAGAGRLTELLGPAVLAADRESRSLGLADAGASRLRELPANSRGRRLLDAFADGVNARIHELGPRDIPFEYHLLGRQPSLWAPINSFYLMGRMGWTLAPSNLEEQQRRARARVAPAAADAIYPVHSPIQEPIVPNGQHAPRYDLLPIPGPAIHDSLPTPCAPDSARLEGREPPCATAIPPANLGLTEADPAVADAVGSNNWAVAASRTAAGYPLLAGDQHLDLTLPSIWYEAHLVVADSVDVYGVTIPGAPGIVIGFNRDLAWTFTNTEADVQDRYAEEVDDPVHPAHYRLDGVWRPLRLEAEPYLDPRGRTIVVDTLRFTHRGPLTMDADGRWISTRWTVLEAGKELTVLAGAARARSAQAWLDSTASYQAPAQNMLVADRAGTIAIRSTGRFPLRPVVRGDLVQRGDTTAADWTGDWPLASLPQEIDPPQGYLASANQEPVDPRVNPRYLGANWYSPWRAIRINQLLRADSAVTPDAMRRYQTDPGSPAADLFVPAFFRAARRYPDRDSLQQAAQLLAQWDRRYTRENTRAVLYEAAIRRLQSLLWDELSEPSVDGPPPPVTPGLAIVAVLLQDPANPWWDNRGTRDVVEDRDAILADALVRAYDETLRRFGPPNGGGWRWDRIRYDNIYHLLQLPALSALRVPVQGGQSTLNPSSGWGTFGPSWRMVVQLGPQVRAWGIYPGGQSGNPASSRYVDRIPRWSNGLLDTLFMPRNLGQAAARSGSDLQLTPLR